LNPRNQSSNGGARIRIVERIVPLPFRIVAVQGVFTVALSMLFFVSGSARAMAALAAGVAIVVPGAWFAWRVNSTRAAAGQSLDAARRLLGSGVTKQLLTVAALVVTFAWFRPEPMAFFATMIVLQGVYLLTPLLVRR
jgi:F0F1-type ATP synthase assembly protein I